MLVVQPNKNQVLEPPLVVPNMGNPPCPNCRGLRLERVILDENADATTQWYARVLVAVVCTTCEGAGSEA